MTGGTDTSFKPGSLGSIKDLLQKANEARKRPIQEARTGSGAAGVEKPPDKDDKYEVDKEGKETEKAADTEPQTAQPTQAHETMPSVSPPTAPPQKTAKTPTAKPKAATEHRHTFRTPTATSDRHVRFKEIQGMIRSFNPNEETGTRHYVFLPADALATLGLAYGEKRLSAILSTLVREHLATYRDEIRRDLTERSSLFEEQE